MTGDLDYLEIICLDPIYRYFKNNNTSLYKQKEIGGGATDIGDLGVLFDITKTHMTLNICLTESICICGRGFADIDCSCEWDGEEKYARFKFTWKEWEKKLKDVE